MEEDQEQEHLLLRSELLRYYTLEECFKIDSDSWSDLKSRYTKEEIVESMASLIESMHLPFPFKVYNMDALRELFSQLRELNIDKMLIPGDTTDLYVTSAFEYERYDYNCYSDHKKKQWGIGCITQNKKFTKLSDCFQQKNRYVCDSANAIGPMNRWTRGGKSLRDQLRCIWRMGEATHLDRDVIRERCKASAYTCSQFRPEAAKVICDMFNAHKVLDFCMGWGDRLCGFYASSTTTHLYGCDPNTDAFNSYVDQVNFYEEQCSNTEERHIMLKPGEYKSSGAKHVHFMNSPAEDIVDFSKLVPEADIDLVMTSPPYFSKERYGRHTEHQELQSWHRYKSVEDWLNQFLFTVIRNVWPVLRAGAYLCINIADVNVNKNRCELCEPMVDFLRNEMKASFCGVIGLRMNKKPHKGIKRNHIGKNVVYMEPIWVFRK
jgi:hypothetical protein